MKGPEAILTIHTRWIATHSFDDPTFERTDDMLTIAEEVLGYSVAEYLADELHEYRVMQLWCYRRLALWLVTVMHIMHTREQALTS